MSSQNTDLETTPWADIPLEDTKLGRLVLKKLHEKQQAANVEFFLRVLNRLQDERCRPSPDDKITNPLNSEEEKKSGLDVSYTTVAEKRAMYNKALDNNEVAYIGFKKTIPLGGPGAEFNDVEFIAGLWRVQKKFPYKVVKVRGKEFVLVKKLPRQEHTKFEFFSAACAVWCGCGRSADVEHPGWIVARYKTNRGIYMAYGQSIEQARAFLGIKMYDEYQDLIDAEICPYSTLRENSR